MHDNIEKYTLTGEVDEAANLVEWRSRMVHWIESEQRDAGIVPLLDIEPQYTHEYNGGGGFNFTLTVYGVNIGKEQSWQVAGVTNGKMIPSSIQRPKLNQS